MAGKQTEEIIAKIANCYHASVNRLREDIGRFLIEGVAPSPSSRKDGIYSYPELTIRYAGVEKEGNTSLAFGRLEKAGTYRTTLTRPELFSDYLTRQLDLLCEHQGIDQLAHQAGTIGYEILTSFGNRYDRTYHG